MANEIGSLTPPFSDLQCQQQKQPKLDDMIPDLAKSTSPAQSGGNADAENVIGKSSENMEELLREASANSKPKEPEPEKNSTPKPATPVFGKEKAKRFLKALGSQKKYQSERQKMSNSPCQSSPAHTVQVKKLNSDSAKFKPLTPSEQAKLTITEIEDLKRNGMGKLTVPEIESLKRNGLSIHSIGSEQSSETRTGPRSDSRDRGGRNDRQRDRRDRERRVDRGHRRDRGHRDDRRQRVSGGHRRNRSASRSRSRAHSRSTKNKLDSHNMLTHISREPPAEHPVHRNNFESQNQPDEVNKLNDGRTAKLMVKTVDSLEALKTAYGDEDEQLVNDTKPNDSGKVEKANDSHDEVKSKTIIGNDHTIDVAKNKKRSGKESKLEKATDAELNISKDSADSNKHTTKSSKKKGKRRKSDDSAKTEKRKARELIRNRSISSVRVDEDHRRVEEIPLDRNTQAKRNSRSLSQLPHKNRLVHYL